MSFLLELLASLLGYRKLYFRYVKPLVGNGQPVPPRTRTLVKQMYGYKCLKCGSMHNVQVDHVVPRSWGGSNSITNLQTLCARCNMQKGNSSAADYRRRR